MRNFLLIPFFLALTLISVLVFIWPKYQSLIIFQNGIKEKESELKAKTDYFLKVKEISAALQDYTDELAKISDAIPSEPLLPSLFDFLKKTASQTGLILKNINLGGVSQPPESVRIKEISVDLELEGSYSALKDFLSAVQRSARLINVRDMSLEVSEKAKEPFGFTVKLKTQSY